VTCSNQNRQKQPRHMVSVDHATYLLLWDVRAMLGQHMDDVRDPDILRPLRSMAGVIGYLARFWLAPQAT
jgi:hypothetical protein